MEKGEFSCFCCPFILQRDKTGGEEPRDFLYLVLTHLERHLRAVEEVPSKKGPQLQLESTETVPRLRACEWERTGVFCECIEIDRTA